MRTKRITLFAGHYGSGKTNIALAFARMLNRGEAAHRVAIADLDIVNPYFRTKDEQASLAAEGIELVVSPYANSNVDFPAMPKEAYGLVADRSRKVVIDVGGDDRGALALGRYVPDIVAENDFDMLAVVNASRPLTQSVADTLEVLSEIESACRLKFTGVVNNTNLGRETRAADVIASVPYADGIARALGVEVRYTCCDRRLAAELEGKVPELFPIELANLYYNLIEDDGGNADEK